MSQKELNHCVIAIRDWMAEGCDTSDIPKFHIAALVAFVLEAHQEQAGFTVSLDFLKRVQESLSDYCGELDWGNADMDLMDEVEAMLAAAPKGDKP